MALTKKQKEIDVIKWEKSEAMGCDACGSFDFCGKCDKSLENPCDKAYKAFNKPEKKTSVKPAAKKSKKPDCAATAKKACSEVAATKTVKKK